MSILIVGGGIGGLVLGLMLNERGIPCTILEAASELRELGVGINLLPPAVAELAALNLLPTLDAIGIRTRELRYANQFGQIIWTELRGCHAGHAMPQFSIHRGKLQRALWRAADARLGAQLRLNAKVVGFEQDDRGVCAELESGEVLRGSVLIGADGIHSTLRASLHPDEIGRAHV